MITGGPRRGQGLRMDGRVTSGALVSLCRTTTNRISDTKRETPQMFDCNPLQAPPRQSNNWALPQDCLKYNNNPSIWGPWTVKRHLFLQPSFNPFTAVCDSSAPYLTSISFSLLFHSNGPQFITSALKAVRRANSWPALWVELKTFYQNFYGIR